MPSQRLPTMKLLALAPVISPLSFHLSALPSIFLATVFLLSFPPLLLSLSRSLSLPLPRACARGETPLTSHRCFTHVSFRLCVRNRRISIIPGISRRTLGQTVFLLGFSDELFDISSRGVHTWPVIFVTRTISIAILCLGQELLLNHVYGVTWKSNDS